MNSRQKIWRFICHYTYGMFAKSFNGATSAMDGFFGLAAGAAVTTDVNRPNWQAAVAIFGAAFVRNAIQWCKDNPIPAQLPDSNPPFNQPTP